MPPREVLNAFGGSREGLTDALKKTIVEELDAQKVVPDRCPRCGSEHVVRRGRDPKGGQRWLCRGCDRTFCASTSSALGMTRLPASTWYEFVDGMVEGMTLRELAERCGVTLKTSWRMRARINEVVSARLDPLPDRQGRSD